MRRHYRTFRSLVAIAAASALSVSPQAIAADTAESKPPLVLGSDAVLRISATIDAGCQAPECNSPAPRRRLRLAAQPGWSAALVEFPENAPSGQPRRPRHGLGVRSQLLESTLQEVGIGARHCLAPVVRMHTKVSSSFDVSGTLWVYARCTFN